MTEIKYCATQLNHLDLMAGLIYESSHELFNFMFTNRADAEKVLQKLLRFESGHFGNQFATVMLVDGEVAGVELGYSNAQLSAQTLSGIINMLRAAPVTAWPHLMGPVNNALTDYVLLPSSDSYYINNLAIDSKHRGVGLGKQLLDHVIAKARLKNYRCIELDVTESNSGARQFYERYGFHKVSQSGSNELEHQYGLPKLNRMRLQLNSELQRDVNHFEQENSSRVINDVTRMNPVEVDEVYVPGSIDQLQQILRANNKPVSIGGGRFSMGGQTASPNTLHIDMRGLNKVIEINPDRCIIRVQAGTRWKYIQQQLVDYGLAVKIMQTYSDFTVGGSISVNCHGRYIGLGPIILSVLSLTLVMQDGSVITVTPEQNSELFFASVGGYGAIGIIVEAELSLAENSRIERISKKMRTEEYSQYFAQNIRNNQKAVFHNADMVPPNFNTLRAITWQTTDKPLNVKEGKASRNLYLAEKYMLWAITETPLGHLRRKYIYEPLLYMRPKITLRNDEANYDVAELEPLSRNKKTYVLQEYFVPVVHLEAFTNEMATILNRYNVQVVNVSIRHAHADPGSLLAWAREEVFALVLYYKQGTALYDRERVAVWTRELIDVVIAHHGTYYLPYQPHARFDQFHSCFPNAKTLFELKNQLDPNYRFRNCLWDKYYRYSGDTPLFGDKESTNSEFLSVYSDTKTRDHFYRFLQNIYHLYPEHEFHNLIINSCRYYDNDEAIYSAIAKELPDIKTAWSDFTFAIPALAKQKKEMQRQTVDILQGQQEINGYLEIGSTGRYVKPLKKALKINRPIYLPNDTQPDLSPADIMERGGIQKVGEFIDLDNYSPINTEQIADESVDLVTCYIGLHHCPRERLQDYIASIYRVLRPRGRFVLRDHDAGNSKMRTFCSLVHTVFNAGLGVSWKDNQTELRLFEGVDFWVEQITKQGFKDGGQRLLQDYDPSLNTLMSFIK